MPAIILDGKALARQIESELITRVQRIREKINDKSPILATILVGDDPASATYVKMKANACKHVGIESLRIVLPQTTTTDELLNEISVEPVTVAIAFRAGRLDGSLQARGLRIALGDLLIAATALELGYAVATHNVRHYQIIPELVLKQL